MLVFKMNTEIVLFLTLLVFSSVLCKPYPYADTCGYESCHATHETNLNIHLIPHSHDDVGWLKTVDQYFYGNNIAKQPGVRGVRYILDSVVQSLQENPDRRFIQVETAFFAQWWKKQDDSTKDIVKNLVNTGQLEFIGGGWSMNDEAATNYQSIVDQFTLGLRTLKDLLGECARPKIGWQIDPFGHTGEMANIFTKLGYEAFFFTRLDYRDIEERKKSKRTEFLWKGDRNLDSNIFTSIIHKFYNAPDTFCWDVQCGDTPIITDENSPEYNVEQRVNEFATYAEDQAKYYKTNNVLITMGGDFTYQQAEMYYMNMDKLIAGFKQFRPDINIIYSTPSCYVNAVNKIAKSQNVTFSLNTGDFMPHASDPHTYWTGFYTSRPNSKRFERQANNLLQVTKQLVSFELAKDQKFEAALTHLKEVMGIMQHHDAITGTEKQHVTDDYVKMLTAATKEAEANVDVIISDLLNKDSKEDPIVVKVESCIMANVSRCNAASKNRFVVAVYNPLSRSVSHYVRVPVTSVKYSVTQIDGGSVTHQVTPSIDKFETVQETPSLYDLVFYAQDLPPMGMKYYYVTKEDTDVNKPDLIEPVADKYDLGTSSLGFTIDNTTGFLKTLRKNNAVYNIKQEFMYYSSAAGDNQTPEKRASGAYIFRPITNKTATSITDKANITVYSGDVVDEVHQQFNGWLKQVIRIYKQENHIEFDWVVGPLEYVEQQGIEVITRFTSVFNSKNTFYTDSNGRGLVKRVRNHRDTYTYTDEEPISGNYYPVTSRIVLKEEERKLQLAVLTDRAQGGTSLESGDVELMIHRKLTHDDAFGVGEVLNETEFGNGVVVRGQHYLVVGLETDKIAAIQHDVVQRKILAPWIFIGDASEDSNSMENLAKTIGPRFAGLTRSLPQNVNIMTLEPWAENTLLLRIEHTFEVDEDTELSKPATVDLKNLLTLFKITSISETTLGANQPIAENKKLEWTVEETENKPSPKQVREVEDAELKIELNPHEIRTFIIGVELEDKTGQCFENCDSGATSINNLHFAIILLLTVIQLFY